MVFKKHRKNLLLEQQLSRLPATMEAADRVRRSEVEQAKADEIKTKMSIKIRQHRIHC